MQANIDIKGAGQKSYSLLLWRLVEAALLLLILGTAPSWAKLPSETSKPEIVLQTGHTLRVEAVAFSPDSRWLASGSADNTVKLWDVATGGELRTLASRAFWVKSVTFSPDGRLLASGGMDGSINLWDVATGQVVRTLTGHSGPVVSLAFSRDGQWLASGSNDKTIKVWDTATGGEPRTLTGHLGWVTTVAFSPDGRWLASGSNDRTVKLWDVAKGRERYTLTGHSDIVNAVAFSPDGSWLASGGSDTKVKVWKVAKGRERFTLTGHSSKVLALSFSPDGRQLIAGGGNKAVKIWETSTGHEVRTLASKNSLDLVETVAFSPDGRWLASGPGDETIELWDVAVGGDKRPLTSHSSPVESVAFSHDGRWLASGSKDKTVKLWDIATGRELHTLTGHTGWVTTIAFSRDGQWLASGSLNGAIKISNVNAGRDVHTLTGHAGSVNAVAFKPGGELLASAGADHTVRLWEVASGRELRSLAGHSSDVNALAFSPNGRWLASASVDKTIKLWEVATGKVWRTFTGHSSSVESLAFSPDPDGQWLASGSQDKSIKLWDINTGREVRTLKGHADSINALIFSPNGRWLASGSNDKAVKLWEIATGRELRELTGHSDRVTSVSFSIDGRWLASASGDGSIRLWETETGRLLATLLSLRESNDWLVVTPDGLFDGSPPAWNQILWRFAQNTFNVAPVESFFNEFYYPGLLVEILAGKSPKASQDISQKDRRQPQVKLMLADGQASHNKIRTRNVPVKIAVTEAPPDKDHRAGSGVRDVRLFRNGLLVKVWRGDVSVDKEGKGILETSIPVIAGENRLTAYAFNHDNIKTTDATLDLTGADSLRRQGTAYILTVGVTKYANSQFNLRYAAADAQDFGDELERVQARMDNFAHVEVIPLLDEEATRANIMLALKRLAGSETGALPAAAPAVLGKIKQAQPEDTVVIYFAGHGRAQENQFFLVPHDLGTTGEHTRLDAEGLRNILEHSISDRALAQAVEAVDASHFLLVIDACDSGQALEAEEKRRGPMNSKGLAQLAYEKGMYILTAAQAYQMALEGSRLGHGYLTYALVEEGLKTAKADFEPQDGQVLLREWLDYATERVPQMQQEKGQRGRLLEQETAPTGPSVVNEKPRDTKQRPRVFYRREAEARPLIIVKPGAPPAGG